MSCVLRVSGAKLLVDDILRRARLSPSVVWHVGEPRIAPEALNLPDHETSGFAVTVSDKEMDDLPGQIEEASSFLHLNEGALTVLVNNPDVENLELDFGVAMPGLEVAATSLRFPSNLIAAASKFRIGLTISQYAVSD